MVIIPKHVQDFLPGKLAWVGSTLPTMDACHFSLSMVERSPGMNWAGC